MALASLFSVELEFKLIVHLWAWLQANSIFVGVALQ